MKKVYKYVIDPSAPAVKMPLGAQILTAREQGDDVCVWALVDPNHPVTETRVFSVLGTGHPAHIKPTAVYLGTAMLMGGSLVLHVFEDR